MAEKPDTPGPGGCQTRCAAAGAASRSYPTTPLPSEVAKLGCIHDAPPSVGLADNR